MNISQALDQTVDHLEKVDWKKVTKEGIALWVTCFKAMVALAVITYLTGKEIGHGVHLLNDWLAHHWVRLIVPQTPVIEEEENEEDEVPLPAPLVEDPWEVPIEVELTLPLEPLVILFTAPMMLAAAQAPVALLAPALVVQEQQSPAPPRRRRQSAQPAVAVTEATPAPTRRPRGRRAHQEERKKARQAA